MVHENLIVDSFWSRRGKYCVIAGERLNIYELMSLLVTVFLKSASFALLSVTLGKVLTVHGKNYSYIVSRNTTPFEWSLIPAIGAFMIPEPNNAFEDHISASP